MKLVVDPSPVKPSFVASRFTVVVPPPPVPVVQEKEPSPSDVKYCPDVPSPITFNSSAPMELLLTETVKSPVVVSTAKALPAVTEVTTSS